MLQWSSAICLRLIQHCLKRERHGCESCTTQHSRNASKLAPAAAPGRHRHGVTRAHLRAHQEAYTAARARTAPKWASVFAAVELRIIAVSSVIRTASINGVAIVHGAACPCKWCCARDENVGTCVKHQTCMSLGSRQVPAMLVMSPESAFTCIHTLLVLIIVSCHRATLLCCALHGQKPWPASASSVHVFESTVLYATAGLTRQRHC